MRLFKLFLFVSFAFVPATAFTQESPQRRDPEAVAILRQSVAAMGGTVPNDSVAVGTVRIVEGSSVEEGTVRILTRGLDYTSEKFNTPESERSLLLAKRAARERVTRSGDADIGTKPSEPSGASLEAVQSSMSPNFPLLILASALANSEFAFEYRGEETIGGVQAHRIRLWNTFASKPRLHPLAEISAKEVWIDVTTALPVKLEYERREARGADGLRFEVFYHNYRRVGNSLYPYRVERSLNGTPWAVIRIDLVSFNNGLSENDFSIQ